MVYFNTCNVDVSLLSALRLLHVSIVGLIYFVLNTLVCQLGSPESFVKTRDESNKHTGVNTETVRHSPCPGTPVPVNVYRFSDLYVTVGNAWTPQSARLILRQTLERLMLAIKCDWLIERKAAVVASIWKVSETQTTATSQRCCARSGSSPVPLTSRPFPYNLSTNVTPKTPSPSRTTP